MSKLALKECVECDEYETEEDESSDVVDDDEQMRIWREKYGSNSNEEGEGESSDEEEEVEKKQPRILRSICKWFFVVISRFWLFPIITYIVIQWISNKPENIDNPKVNKKPIIIGIVMGAIIVILGFLFCCYIVRRWRLFIKFYRINHVKLPNKKKA